jgi:hypothetical protein
VSNTFNTFEKLYYTPLLKQYAKQLLETVALSSDYYGLVGLGDLTVSQMDKAAAVVESYLGVEKGNVVKGGLLDTVSNLGNVRQKVISTIANGISGKMPLNKFANNLQKVVIGSGKDAGLLQQHWRTYVYDLYNQSHEAANNLNAEQLGLKYFIYQGSLIDTSRAFCKKRAGKVFSVEETKTWKDDPTLVGKNKELYNPLIERGRWNCRHFINYISEDLYKQLKASGK